MRRIGCLAVWAGALLVLGSARAVAGPDKDDAKEAQSEAANGEPEPEPKAKAKAKAKNRLEMGGRVFVRSTVSRTDIEAVEDDPWLSEYGVSSARIVADYRRGRRLKVMVEAELGDDEPELKDGYIRVRPVRELSIKAGRFKRPMSAISLESAWGLPTVDRGILNRLEPWSAIELPFGGRGDGLTVAYELRDVAARPEFTAGVFEPDMPDNPIDVSEHVGLDPYARAQAAPIEGLDVGLSVALVTFQRVYDDREAIGHAPVAGVDFVLRQGPVKAWLEGFYGESTVYDQDGRSRAQMWAARTILSLRLKRLTPWLRRAGPFLKASIFDPNTGAGDDRAIQYGGGVNARFTKYMRLQLEVEQTSVDDVALLLQQDRLAFYAQLGAAF